MPQIILDIPRQKLSLVYKLLSKAGINLSRNNYTRKITDAKNSAHQVFTKIFSWDYNRSELEFE